MTTIYYPIPLVKLVQKFYSETTSLLWVVTGKYL